MNLECEHGQLARSCNICEYEREIAELNARVGELTQSRDEWRRIALEAKERVEGLLLDVRKMVKRNDRP
jgi:hypothetical protein